MSLAEIKQQVPLLTAAELEELAACVGLAIKAREPEWLERAARINREMDQGRAHSAEEVLKLHRKLSLKQG